MKKFIGILFFVLLIIILVIGFDVYHKVFRPYKGYPGSVNIQIEKGSPVSVIGELLYQKKIISSYSIFTLYYRLFFSSLSLKSGEYQFDAAMTMKEVIMKLHSGKMILYKITVKEGMTLEETGEFLAANHGINDDDFIRITKNSGLIMDLDPDADDLEGYLFPDTYLVPGKISAEDLVGLMIQKFRKNFTNPFYLQAQRLHFSIRNVVTLASLIEKETAAREERFLISSVFHNRLKRGMPLACDPTIIYILKKQNQYTGDIRWKDLKLDSPYNTRKYPGLPPGPICSPGLASIEAALYPEETDYLYFVAKDLKTHYFSKTLKEHNWAVRKYIINQERFN
jgi:UPF0755 protein